jgi:hypothetical protein
MTSYMRKDMEGQITWEEGNLEPLEVVEKWVNVAPQVGMKVIWNT